MASSSSPKQPAKSILKKSNNHEHKNKDAKFDEMNILATYHPADKDYGHMKIDEPKTPYRSDNADDHDIDASEISRRLESASDPKVMRQNDSGSGRSDDDDDTLSPEEREKRKRFKAARKQHYNMKEQMKKAKELLAKEELEDD